MTSSTGLRSVDWKSRYDHLKLKSTDKNLLLVGIRRQEDGSVSETPLASFWPEGCEIARDFLEHIIGTNHRR